ncbi:hypothetical protein D3C78_1356600 [compost metagenome]
MRSAIDRPAASSLALLMRMPDDRRCMEVDSEVCDDVRLRCAFSDWMLVLMVMAMVKAPKSNQNARRLIVPGEFLPRRAAAAAQSVQATQRKFVLVGDLLGTGLQLPCCFGYRMGGEQTLGVAAHFFTESRAAAGRST